MGKLLIFVTTVLVCFVHIKAQCVRDAVSNCAIYDSLHTKNFDGSVYSLTSSCGYTVASIPGENLEINLLRNPAGVQIIYEGRTYFVSVTAGVATLTVNGVATPVPSTVNGVTVSQPGKMAIVEIKELGIKLRYEGTTFEYIQDNAGNTMVASGLCGNNDGCNNNDLVMRDGQTTTSVTAWADSWATSACSATTFPNACGANIRLQAQAQTYCNNLFANAQFAPCAAYRSIYNAICISTYCSCSLANRNDCMCDMLDSFVRTCETKTNSVIDWRTPTRCRVQCVNPDLTYLPCAPDRRQLTCGQPPLANPQAYDCEEGCYCPAGMRLFEGRCLFPNECPCFFDGDEYQPGQTRDEECNTCTCTDGMWSCTQKECVVDGDCVGDPHYKTFDGVKYDFMGKCQYYVVRGIGFDVICDHYVRNPAGGFMKNYNTNAPSFCLKMIILTEGDRIEIGQDQVTTVNGRRIPWKPWQVSGSRITQPSSQYTTVTLRNKVRCSFNGQWWASCTIPMSMKYRVTGLFGYYSGLTTDEFRKPDGTLAANANEFGHSYAVPGSCPSNVNTDPPVHPCVENPGNQPAAQAACDLLLQPLFAGCSDTLQSDYDDCVYDGCQCGPNEWRCYCEMYELQARKCASKGIAVDWRPSAPQCALACPAGQAYQACGNPCTRTCEDISQVATCTARCTEGCNCPSGQTLDSQGECVPIASCPCILNGARFPAGFTYVNVATGIKFVCQNARWPESEASPEDMNNFPSLHFIEDSCDISEYLVYAGCKPTDTLTCLNKHLEQPTDYDNCQAGCECQQGFVWDSEREECVRPEDCPCMYNDVSYPDDHVISNRYEQCTCVEGLWECVPATNHWEICSAWGDVHVRTFDQSIFSFEGYCEYVLLERVFGTGVFRVTIETGSCNTGSCIATVYIHHRAENGLIENVIFTTGPNYINAPANLQNLVISDLNPSIMVDVVGLGIRVIFNVMGWVHVHASSAWLTWESNGLCGKYDNDASNDFEVNGVNLAVASWVDYNRLDRFCAAATEQVVGTTILPANPCDYLFDDVFKTCSYNVDPQPYYEACLINAQNQAALPVEQQTNYYCETLAAYAQECSENQMPVNWRTAEICPLECPVNEVYYPCDIPCARENCANTNGYENLCGNVCGETCNTPQCPDGTVYLDATNAQCVTPDQCPVLRRGSVRRLIARAG